MDIRPEDLLRDHVVLRTHDLAAYHALIAGMEGSHDRQVLGEEPLEIELRFASLGDVEVGVQHCTVAMRVEIARHASDSYIVQFPLTGRFDLEVDGREFAFAPGSGAVISPGQHIRRSGQPGWTLAIRLPGHLVRARLESRLGRLPAGGLEFHPRIIASSGELLAYCLLVVEAIDRGVAPAGSHVAGVLEDGLVGMLLDRQPHNQGSVLFRAEAAKRSARIRAVDQHVDNHLAGALPVPQLARVARCNVRSLQETFMELCGMSPAEYVRRRRLSAARAMLEAGGDVTVAAIAKRTGFAHLARFSGIYRARYGEYPSDTLRRARALRTSR
jgi:AraC-like DNA-binding protein